MPDTIDGGAYLVNERWVSAEGKPLGKAQIGEAERLHDDLATQRLATEQERVERAVRNDPMAQVLASAFRSGPGPLPPPPQPVDEVPKSRGRSAEKE